MGYNPNEAIDRVLKTTRAVPVYTMDMANARWNAEENRFVGGVLIPHSKLQKGGLFPVWSWVWNADKSGILWVNDGEPRLFMKHDPRDFDLQYLIAQGAKTDAEKEAIRREQQNKGMFTDLLNDVTSGARDAFGNVFGGIQPFAKTMFTYALVAIVIVVISKAFIAKKL